MINRTLIRTRVVQIVYSWHLSSGNSLQSAEKNLMNGLQKSYDLYHYLLALMLEITKAHESRIETKRNKFLPTDEDLNPNMNLINNKFIAQLADNKQLLKHLEDRPMSWDEYDVFIRNLLDDILASDIYKEYANIDNPSYDEDKEFWRKAFKKFIFANEELDELLEDESIYWNDDIEIVQSFVIKTIKRFSEEEGANQPLLPMFKDDEDKMFATELLHDAILNSKKYEELVEKHVQKWDSERIAMMDMIIMQVALAEIFTFDNIPTNVTMNEYIEIAKSYSTPKSSIFINGILDAIVLELRNEKLIFKP
ncbi:MAG: transcription antitermination factor NusB [Fermentimonas sp.]|jgi:N utilization substance protein B